MTRVVSVKLAAQVADYNKGMLEAANATRTVGTEAEKLAQKREAFQTLGRGLVVYGAAMVATTALTVRAAAQWESAWAGVTKTVDGTPEQLAEVEQGLRDLTKVLPATHDEIAAVAEAAGQLGIETENVVSFTKTMIDLGETTNLSAEQAATSLARFTNIMGTSQDKVSNLGSALVGLGNNYATTESEILEMSMRLAGAGRQINLSEGDVLGLATALSSVGIEAEAGGSAMSKVMIDIASSVDSGGERVQAFARVAGMSAEEFSRKWKTEPTAALAAFVKGLGNAEAQGSSAIGVLGELGITEVRMRDALLRSAAAADVFSDAIEMGNSEFEKNNALTLEAEKRYETVESSIAMAGNAINDAAISFGEVLLPAVGAAADAVSGFAGFLGGLPGPIQGVITLLVGVSGLIALTGGAALLAVPKIAQFKTALDTMGWSMKGLSLAGGGALIALTALVTVIGAVSAAQAAARQRAESYADALRQSEDAVQDLVVSGLQAEKSFLWMSRGSAYDAAEKLGINLETVTKAATGSATAMEDLSLYTRAADGDMDALNQIVDETGLSHHELASVLDVLVGSIREQNDGLSEGERLMGQAADASSDTADEVSDFEKEVSDAENALSDMNQALEDVGATALGMGDAVDRAQSAVNSLTEAAKEEDVTIDGLNDTSIRFRSSLRDVEKSHRDASKAIIDNNGTVEDAIAKYREGRKAIEDNLIAKGMDAEAAKTWADAQMGSADDAEQAIRDYADAVKAVPDKKVVKLVADTAPAMATINQFVIDNNGRRINFYVDGYVGRQVSGNQLLLDRAAANGMFEAYANGGFPTGIYAGRAGAIHKFAEPETRWEAYISGKPGQEARNIGIWQEAGRRLGVGSAQTTPVVVSATADINTASIEQLAAALYAALRDVRNADGRAAQLATMQGVR